MAARSTKITFENKTAHTLTRHSDNLDHGIWTTECPSKILPNSTVVWESESDGLFTGTEGEVTYTISNDQSDFGGIPGPAQLFLHWDNPYVGGNSYNHTMPLIFGLTRSGGSGDNAEVTYKFTELRWFNLVHQPPFAIGTMLLLTDASVLAFEANGKRVAKLKPDSAGHYVNALWTTLSPMNTARLYFASAVLADGRVLVAGGEYNGGKKAADISNCEIYDPLHDNLGWKNITGPSWGQVGDAVSCALPNGKLLIGDFQSNATAIFDSATNKFTDAGINGLKNSSCSEETWTLLRDGSVLSVDCSNPNNAERYIPAQDKWVAAGSTPEQLPQSNTLEIGAALLLTNGNVFVAGGTGKTAIYHPVSATNPTESWKKGPDFPKDSKGKLLEAKDAPGCLLPNGTVVCAAGPHDETLKGYPGPTTICLYDPNTNKLRKLGTNSIDKSGAPFTYTFLLLPTGDMLMSGQSQKVAVFRSGGVPNDNWRPVITSVAATLAPGSNHVLKGKLLNGLSQACSYGDDAQMATNYPIVRLRTSDGHVHYCRTHGHSTMGVADHSEQSTNFHVPTGIAKGAARLNVIANGIFSVHVDVKVV